MQVPAVAAFVCSTILVSLVSAEEPSIDEAFKVHPDPAGQAYFPKGKASFYTPYLTAIKEPSLMPQAVTKEDAFSIRFTWLRSRHDPIVVRIWHDRNGYQMRSVKLARRKDEKPGAISIDETRTLTDAEVEDIKRLETSKDLWKALTPQESAIFSLGKDGAMWIFERQQGKNYSLLDLWSPKEFANGLSDPPAIRDFKEQVSLGLHLLKLAKLLPKDEREIY